MKTREKELLAKEAELNRREKVTGSNIETGNWNGWHQHAVLDGFVEIIFGLTYYGAKF